MKKNYILIVFAILLLSVTGCKKEKPVVEKQIVPHTIETPTPEPTRTPPTFEELYSEAEKQTKELAESFGLKDIGNSFNKNVTERKPIKVNIPDGEYTAVVDSKIELNLFDMMKNEVSFTINANAEAVKNIAEGSVTMVLSGKDDEGKEHNETNEAKFYIDNTGSSTISYTKTNDRSWMKDVKSADDIVSNVENNLENYVSEDMLPKDIFLNTDKFIKDRTEMNETADGYELVTKIDWNSFYEFYKDDFNKLLTVADEQLNSLMDNSYSEEDVPSLTEPVKEMFSATKASVDVVYTFDKSLKMRKVEFKLNDLIISIKLPLGKLLNSLSNGESQMPDELPVELNIPYLNVTVTMDKTDKNSIVIPQNVKDNAEEKSVPKPIPDYLIHIPEETDGF